LFIFFSAKERKTSGGRKMMTSILEKWLLTISNPGFSVVQSMQDKFQNVVDENFDETDAQKFLTDDEQKQVASISQIMILFVTDVKPKIS
jgi:hypothetical protein